MKIETLIRYESKKYKLSVQDKLRKAYLNKKVTYFACINNDKTTPAEHHWEWTTQKVKRINYNGIWVTFNGKVVSKDTKIQVIK